MDGARAETYGPARENFTRFAMLLNAVYFTRMKEGSSFKTEDSILIMKLMKLSRLAFAIEKDIFHTAEDSVVDDIGYALLWEKIGSLEES